MTTQRPGTSRCGWCIGPEGAIIPHHWGRDNGLCPCPCADEIEEEEE